MYNPLSKGNVNKNRKQRLENHQKKTSQNNIFIADANKLYAFFIIILIL